ncbi:MAG: hypothetical protein ABI358_08085 [Ginsengibacter sp.]
MAELHVQRKRNNYVWVWIVLIIVIIAAAFYYYTNYYKKNNTATDNVTGLKIKQIEKQPGTLNFLEEVKKALNESAVSKRETHPVVFLN